MRRGLAAACILLHFLTTALGQAIPFPGPGTGVSAPSLVFQTNSTPAAFQSSISSFTFTSVAIGTAAANRTVIVSASIRCVGGDTITGVTVGGVTAALAKSQANNVTNSSFSSIWTATVPSGTTGNIVLTLVGVDTCIPAIGVWSAYGLTSNTPTATAGSTSSSSQTLSVNVSAGGIVIGSSYGFSASSITWSGLTRDYDQVTLATTQQQSGASASAQPAASPLAITATIPSAGGGEASGVAASFR